ncbi:hypothetical protein Asfd1_165 [Aeromonas phage Asfd_1]|nr:hypothetical protein Asfd1_165 [Aeromonas phage Asfd_1]
MVANKWQKPGLVMNKVLESAFIHLLGPDVKGVIFHSYRDIGDGVIVNYELMVNGKPFIGSTTILE